ncbi:hypothetical protein ACWWSA_14085 [Mycobacteroides abscessus subsp. abscessus]
MKNSNQLQQRALKAVTAQLPIDIDGSNVIVEDGLSYTRSPIKAHDYATGLFSAFGGAVEYLGRMRGLPAQTLTVNRRLSGLSLNSLQLTFSNGRALGFDDYTTGPDNGIYRTRDNRFFGMIGLHPKLRDGITEYLGATSREGRGAPFPSATHRIWRTHSPSGGCPEASSELRRSGSITLRGGLVRSIRWCWWTS